jgi:hypothetical protein
MKLGISVVAGLLGVPLVLPSVMLPHSLGERAQREPVALVIDATQRVQVVRATQELAEAVQVGFRLHPGDQLLVPGGSRAVLLYRNGRMERVTGTLTLAAGRDFGTLGLGGLISVLDQRPRRGEGVSGELPNLPSGGPVPLQPPHGATILSARPHFIWHAAERADGYVLTIEDGLSEPRRFQVGHATEWRIPGDVPPLMRGRSYRWTVSSGGGMVASAGFSVIAEPVLEVLTGRLIEIDGSVLAEQRPLLRLLSFLEAGLVHEASRELDAMAASGISPELILQLAERLAGSGS